MAAGANGRVLFGAHRSSTRVPAVDRKLVGDVTTLRFITEKRPILLLSQPCGSTTSRRHIATRFRSRAAIGATFPPQTIWWQYSPKPAGKATGRPSSKMFKISGDAVVAAAILDRLMRNAVVFNIKAARGG